MTCCFLRTDCALKLLFAPLHPGWNPLDAWVNNDADALSSDTDVSGPRARVGITLDLSVIRKLKRNVVCRFFSFTVVSFRASVNESSQ